MQHSADLASAVHKMVEDHDGRLFLVDVQWHPERRQLRILVDTDEGIRLHECSALHLELRSLLTEAGWIDEDYSLEVSSPGVGKPLKHERQYRQNLGRTVDLQLEDGRRLAGKLIHVTGESLSLEIVGDQPRKSPETTNIPLTEVKTAKVVATFN